LPWAAADDEILKSRGISTIRKRMQKKAPTILVVDDDDLNRKLLGAILAKEGYSVLTAPSAEDGVELARTHQPDLILMDIRLRGMDGLTATRLLKQDQRTGHIAVAAISAYAMNEDRVRAAEAGCAAYFTKPFDLSGFIDEVRRLVAARQTSITES
jgi:two-component system, cell cycle response regulator DivK